MFSTRMSGSVEDQNSGLSCLKYIVLGFNALFMMTGCMMVSIGTTVFGVYYYFNTFLETRFLSPASLLIVVGGFIFLVAIMGFIAVIKESTLMINTYSVLLCFIYLLQISAGIAAIVLKSNVADMVSTNMNRTLVNYPYNMQAAESMDILQKSLKCCGIYSPWDWKDVFSTRAPQYTFHDVVLPHSCCAEFFENENDYICLKTQMAGCLPRLTLIVYQTLRILFGSSLTLAIIQLFGLSFTYKLAKLLIQIKSERLAREMVRGAQTQNIYDALDIHNNRVYIDKPPSYDELHHTFK